MKYNDYAIERLQDRLLELFMKKSTPQKYSVVMFEAVEVIRQLKEQAAPPPNDPLTLEELREMDGEPMYLDFADGGEWVLVRAQEGKVFITHKNTICSPVNILFECGGKAYRRKPEEGTT